MDDMRELVTREQVETAFRVLALMGPVAGGAAGFLYGRLRRRSGLAVGVLLGCLGALNYGLWRLYLAVTDRLGMDRVSTLLANLGIFIVLGVGGGLFFRRLHAQSDAKDDAKHLRRVKT